MHPVKQWILRTNVYEVNTRQYTKEGTINAFKQHLPRLMDMGVEILWFMPLTPIAKVKRKGTLGSYYACSDYTAIDPEFGTMDDFKELVREAHNLGFKVIIDWVANHTGWDHRWTWEHPEYYRRDEAGTFLTASGMDDIIELDYTNPDLRLAMMEAMQFWIDETKIDGFRCDLASWVELDFWLDAIPALEKIKPLFWLGELDPLESPDYMQVFDAGYTWKWMHGTKTFYETRPGLQPLTDIIEKYIDSPGIKAWFTSNHDENSWNGTEYEKYGDAALLLAVFSCTFPGIPLVYSGQEIPNQKRLKFFDRDTIEWKEELGLHQFYKQLFTLRKQHPAISAEMQNLTVLSTSKPNEVFAYKLEKEEDAAIVFLNFSAGVSKVNFSASRITGSFKEIYSGQVYDLTNQKVIELDPWEYNIFIKEQ